MKLTATFLLVSVLITTMAIPISMARRHRGGRRKSKIPSPQKEIGSSSATDLPSRFFNPETGNAEDVNSQADNSITSSQGRKRNKQNGILKTSVKAKIITERRYLKSDWCKSQPVRQHIRTKDKCHAVIINQFCYGQCNSFYIPKDINTDERNEDLHPEYFKSCSFCKPKTEEWISVRLRCKRSKGRRKSRFVVKKIKRVKGCTCIAVPDLEKTSATTEQRNDIAPSIVSEINATSVASRYTSNR